MCIFSSKRSWLNFNHGKIRIIVDQNFVAKPVYTFSLLFPFPQIFHPSRYRYLRLHPHLVLHLSYVIQYLLYVELAQVLNLSARDQPPLILVGAYRLVGLFCLPYIG